MKIVINRQHGGFNLSDKAAARLRELRHAEALEEHAQRLTETWEHYGNLHYIARNDPLLIQVVEELGEEASGDHSDLEIVEVPDDRDWHLCEHDGKEWVELYDVTARDCRLI